MRILLVHNHYAQRGGEDAVFAQERDLLRLNGNQVIEYTRDNRDLPGGGSARLAVDAFWSKQTDAEVGRLIDRCRPDIVHVHNTLPQISPSVYYAASRRRVPVIQTLHNYRLVCANGLLLRGGEVCEACVGRAVPLPAVVHACYRGSRAATASVVATIGIHRMMGTWRGKVTRYIALCEFARRKILHSGVPPERVVIKPNFVVDRHSDILDAPVREGALFVGRLAMEKGCDTLIDAWRHVSEPLSIYGTGDLEAGLKASAPANVRFLGFGDAATIGEAMRKALFLVMPSRFYEGFPVVLAEAFSAGLPIIASRHGALAELVRDQITGLHFSPGNASELAAKVQWALANKHRMFEMGRAARETYEQAYAPASNYRRLLEIYSEALEAAQRHEN